MDQRRTQGLTCLGSWNFNHVTRIVGCRSYLLHVVDRLVCRFCHYPNIRIYEVGHDVSAVTKSVTVISHLWLRNAGVHVCQTLGDAERYRKHLYWRPAKIEQICESVSWAPSRNTVSIGFKNIFLINAFRQVGLVVVFFFMSLDIGPKQY